MCLQGRVVCKYHFPKLFVAAECQGPEYPKPWQLLILQK